MSGPYDDIINLPHHVSEKHRRMSVSDRAAQFSPFAALTGFGAAISEAGRLTDTETELDEDEKELINGALRTLAQAPEKRALVNVTWFRPDGRKAGGAYVTSQGRVKRLDEYSRTLLMSDGEKIPIDCVAAIEIKDNS